MFKFKKGQSNKRGQEYIERAVKKFPKVLFWLFFTYFILFVLFISWFVYFKSTYIISRVEGVSMQYTINPNGKSDSVKDDCVYVNVSRTDIHRGEIIVIGDIIDPLNGELLLDKDTGQPKNIIKRALAFGGEKVTIMLGDDDYYHVYLYNEQTQRPEELYEPYIRDPAEWRKNVTCYHTHYGDYESSFYTITYTSGHMVTIDDIIYFEVPEAEIFYLGDNRDNSSDFRRFGSVKISQLKGIAEIVLPDAEHKTGLDLLNLKISKIFEFYWKKLTDFFAR